MDTLILINKWLLLFIAIMTTIRAVLSSIIACGQWKSGAQSWQHEFGAATDRYAIAFIAIVVLIFSLQK